MMNDPIPASVMVLTRNSAATLEACLDSVAGFAEVVVCDGKSSDSTVAIARRSGCVVMDQDAAFTDDEGRLTDYAGARFQAVEAATEPWVFHLDADEVATPELVAQIRRVTSHSSPGGPAGYVVGARHLIDGTIIRSAANYPMEFLRLFRCDAVVGYKGPINESPEFADNAEIGRLDEDFLIPMPALRAVLRKWARYQRIIFRDSASQGEPIRSVVDARSRWRVTRWLAWRIWKSRRSEPGPHMPLRYEFSRVGFHAASLASATAGALSGRLRPRRGA